MSATDYSTQFKPAETALKKLEEDIRPFESIISQFEGLGETNADRIKGVLKNEKDTGHGLAYYRDEGYNKLKAKVKITNVEENSLKAIIKAIENPEDYKDKGPDFDAKVLGIILGFTTNDALFNK
ncbi:hypothetical protein C1645_745468 [Glomus cerebriforme]|uniref:Uncharacterized protein n=1 Tax=Glomus cerebriforme TaxID=658196 RepID=A0A397SCN0_9GLOM|nr:hypothetical protein C1645_745468 [Glomus cerebriforme]